MADLDNDPRTIASSGCQPSQFLPQPVKLFGVSGEQDPLNSDITLQLGNSRATVTDDDDVFTLLRCPDRLGPRNHLCRVCGERE